MLLCTCSKLFLGDLFWSVTWFLSINKHGDCSVLNCYTDQTYKIRFHSFPKDEKFKKTWSNFQESQVSGLQENLMLSVQNMLKTNTFLEKSSVITLFPVSIADAIIQQYKKEEFSCLTTEMKSTALSWWNFLKLFKNIQEKLTTMPEKPILESGTQILS